MRVTADAGNFKVQLSLPMELASAVAPSETLAEEQEAR